MSHCQTYVMNLLHNSSIKRKTINNYTVRYLDNIASPFDFSEQIVLYGQHAGPQKLYNIMLST